MNSPLDAWAEADKAQWKAVQSAIQLTEKLGNFIGAIVGPAASDLGGLLGDQMKSWRAANLARIEAKWRARLASRQTSVDVIKTLPFRDAYLTLEACSLEDDPDVQDLWARLIANATDLAASVEIKKMHIDLIKSLSGLEARIIALIFERFERGDFSDRDALITTVQSWPALKSEQLRVALQNIQRLGLITVDISENNILEFQTYEEWTGSLTEENIVDRLKILIPNLMMEISNYSGNPMNDLVIPDNPPDFVDLISTYTLTRIGFDLWEAVRVRAD